jgi:hypothetical protein
MKMKKYFTILIAATLLSMSSVASAAFISGGIAFSTSAGADWTPVDALFAPSLTIAGAQGVVFNPGFNGSDGFVSNATGDYAGTAQTLLQPADLVDFQDFIFNPFTPVATLWSFTSVNTGLDYSLSMTSASIVAQNSTQINLRGNALLDITGFDQTVGTWNLTMNASAFGSPNAILSFSSDAADVPVPNVALLMGLGLIGLGVVARRKKAQA